MRFGISMSLKFNSRPIRAMSFRRLASSFVDVVGTHNGEISKMSNTLEEMKRSFQTEKKKLIETHNKEMFKVTEEHDELVVRLNKFFENEKEELEEM